MLTVRLSHETEEPLGNAGMKSELMMAMVLCSDVSAVQFVQLLIRMTTVRPCSVFGNAVKFRPAKADCRIFNSTPPTSTLPPTPTDVMTLFSSRTKQVEQSASKKNPCTTGGSKVIADERAPIHNHRGAHNS
jgi:hypothetical protein